MDPGYRHLTLTVLHLFLLQCSLMGGTVRSGSKRTHIHSKRTVNGRVQSSFPLSFLQHILCLFINADRQVLVQTNMVASTKEQNQAEKEICFRPETQLKGQLIHCQIVLLTLFGTAPSMVIHLAYHMTHISNFIIVFEEVKPRVNIIKKDRNCSKMP